MVENALVYVMFDNWKNIVDVVVRGARGWPCEGVELLRSEIAAAVALPPLPWIDSPENRTVLQGRLRRALHNVYHTTGLPSVLYFDDRPSIEISRRADRDSIKSHSTPTDKVE
jgi:hypothetical protein